MKYLSLFLTLILFVNCSEDLPFWAEVENELGEGVNYIKTIKFSRIDDSSLSSLEKGLAKNHFNHCDILLFREDTREIYCDDVSVSIEALKSRGKNSDNVKHFAHLDDQISVSGNNIGNILLHVTTPPSALFNEDERDQITDEIYAGVRLFNDFENSRVRVDIWSSNGNDVEVVFEQLGPQFNNIYAVASEPVNGNVGPVITINTNVLQSRFVTGDRLNQFERAELRLTMAHEVGHLIGLLHTNNPPNQISGYLCGSEVNPGPNLMDSSGGEITDADEEAISAMYPNEGGAPIVLAFYEYEERHPDRFYHKVNIDADFPVDEVYSKYQIIIYDESQNDLIVSSEITCGEPLFEWYGVSSHGGGKFYRISVQGLSWREDYGSDIGEYRVWVPSLN